VKKPTPLILIVVWELISVLGAVIGIAAINAFAFDGLNPTENSGLSRHTDVWAIYGFNIVIFTLLGYIHLAIAGAIGVLKNKEWGRVVSLVHGIFSLVLIPVGSIIGAFVIIYLIRQDVRGFFLPEAKSSANA